MRPSDEPIIRIENVSKTFGSVRAADRVSLSIERGEFFALIGPSGCGKTTLLRMLAGFETPGEGRIIVAGQDMATVPPNKRPVNMVFQSYAVFPHMSVAENIGYGLRMENRPAKEIAARTEEALALVKLSGLGNRRPDEISGGQRQRVALARALVKRPQVLLLDEPLSALDARLRDAMRLELAHLQKTVGITFVIVTHDQSEALSMADRIAVMNEGRILQLAPPQTLYEAPGNRFVAEFIGKINFFEGNAIPLPQNRLRILTEGIGEVEMQGAANGPVTLAVRPEKIQLSRHESSASGLICVQGAVSETSYHGGASSVLVKIAGGKPLLAEISNVSRAQSPHISRGDKVWCAWRRDDMLLLTE
jgi:spermidine/putrescine ABC transporter ATP-binding subunit